MDKQMRVMYLRPQGGIVPGVAPVPTIGADEALVRVLVCGVCSSDMGAYRGGLGQPTILGHEVVGVVTAVGAEVRNVQPGDRVTGTMMRGYAEYVSIPARDLLPVPASLTDAAAIVEPLCCMYNGLERSGAQAGDRAAVVGAGYMGLLLAALLRANGVQDVTVIDPKAEARANAEKLGLTALAPEDAQGGYPFVYEATGAQGGLTLSTKLLAANGTLCVVGYHPGVREIDMNEWAAKAPTVINAFEYNHARQLRFMALSLALAAEGKLPTGDLFTHEFAFDDTDRAFQTHLARPAGFIKGYIRVSR